MHVGSAEDFLAKKAGHVFESVMGKASLAPKTKNQTGPAKWWRVRRREIVPSGWSDQGLLVFASTSTQVDGEDSQ